MKRLLQILNRLEEGALALTLLGLAFLSFVEVVLRYAFGHSFTWYEELSRYLGVFITFLGASLGVKHGLHFSMDYLVGRVPPRAGHLMRLASNLLSAGLFLLIAWLTWQHAQKLWRFGVTSPAMGLPMFWAYLPIPLFSLTLGLRFLRQTWRFGLLAAGREAARP